MSSVPEYAERYKVQSRARENGIRDGQRNFPPHDQSELTSPESHILLLAQNDFNQAADEWRETCAEHMAAQRAAFGQVPINFTFTLADFKAECELRMLGYDRETIDAWRRMDERNREYRGFKELHRLNRDADPEGPWYVAFAGMFAAAIAETVANSTFFKDVSQSGLLGGAALALAISLINSTIGFLTGALPLRYLHHRHRLHVLWAFPTALGMAGALVFFNLLVGHLRDAISRLATPGLGNIQTADVLNPLLRSPFGLTTLDSWFLFLIGLTIAAYSAYKGFNVFDPYPRFGKTYELKEQTEAEFNAQLVSMKGPLDESASACLKRASDEFAGISKNLASTLEALDMLDSVQQSFQDQVKIIDTAGNAALMEYRMVNAQVRSSMQPVPDYFHRAWQPQERLQGEIETQQEKHVTLREEVGKRTQHLRKQYEDLIHGVPETIARLLSEDAISQRINRILERGQEEARRQRE